MSDLIQLAKQLISCPSITPNDAGAQTILIQRLEALGFHCESKRFADVDNLFARYGKAAPLLVFAGHTDVVPPGPETDWTSPPFHPEIRDGYLYGRGACDMKAAIAAMVIAVEHFLKKKPNVPGSIGFLITSDEEGPSINGTKKMMALLTERQEKIDYCIIGEPSSNEVAGDQIRIGRRGSLHGSLNVHGVQGHVAHPHLAKNPLHLSALALHQLSQTIWDQGNADFPATTFQITQIKSGASDARNVIPGRLLAEFNFRFSTAVTPDELQAKTRAILEQHQLTFDLSFELGAQPFLSKKGKLIASVQTAIKEISGLNTILSTGGGTSDGRFIAPTGAEVVELGASNRTAHHVNEAVAVQDVETLAQVYEQILMNVFNCQ